MIGFSTQNFWATTARIILRNRITILIGVFLFTIFMAIQWKNMRFSNTEANLLPDNHPVNLAYKDFVSRFGEEGNIIAIAIKDSALFELNNFKKWNRLSKQLAAFPEVIAVLSTDNLKLLERSETEGKFVFSPFKGSQAKDQKSLDKHLQDLYQNQPFYDQLLFNKETGTLRTLVYLDKEIINTSVRKDFVLRDLKTLLEKLRRRKWINSSYFWHALTLGL